VRGYEQSVTMILHRNFRYEYLGNEVKAYSPNDDYTSADYGKEELDIIISFKDSKISQIKDATSDYKISYYYSGDILKYMLTTYTYINYYGNIAESRDSMSVIYDLNGDNITELIKYSYNNSVKNYIEKYRQKITYDDKINPLRNSIYAILDTDGMENMQWYFNKNNVTSLDESESGSSYDPDFYFYNYNVSNLPTLSECRDFSGVIHKSYFFYQCD